MSEPSPRGELLIAVNPDPDSRLRSRLRYLLRLPLGAGMVFLNPGIWPSAKALYCYPVGAKERPSAPVIVEQVPGLRNNGTVISGFDLARPSGLLGAGPHPRLRS